MKRRNFLKLSGLASGTLLVPGFLKPFDKTMDGFAGKRLVIVQLSGGNDGLNSLIPFRNDQYYKLRPKLGIQPDKLLKITDEAGFNPALEGFRKLYDEGYMAVYNSVGYPNPDRSHFRSMDIWHTAANADEFLNTGWIGRLLDANCPGAVNPWFAMEIDDTLSLSMKGINRSGFAVKDPERLHKLMNDKLLLELAEAPPATEENSELGFLYKTLARTTSSAEYIYEKSKIYHSARVYPEHEFGKSLKQISGLIGSGMESRIYYTSISGFDTHVRQLETQQRLLKITGDSLYNFSQDLKERNEWNNTVVMVFSEFGRRVKQNASQGTDHGTANNVYLIGGDLRKKGVINPMANLTDLDDGDLKHQIDFRNIYAGLLDNVISFNHELVLGRKFESLYKP